MKAAAMLRILAVDPLFDLLPSSFLSDWTVGRYTHTYIQYSTECGLAFTPGSSTYLLRTAPRLPDCRPTRPARLGTCMRHGGLSTEFIPRSASIPHEVNSKNARLKSQYTVIYSAY